jgi:hypothetical protein
MAAPSAERTTEWEGGSLGELVAVLQATALPVRIEVFARGVTDSSAGEVHLLAGGLADAFAGSLRREDALAALQRLEGARYLVQATLPDPETGSLSVPGPQQGSLKDRPLASLMRYCEDYVLTCRLEAWRGQERAVISYRRGEIVGTTVGGGEGSDRLPEVMAWNDGSYDIVLPAPALPQTPARKGAARPVEPLAKAERKRHGTLPMTPGSEPSSPPESAASGPPASAPPAPAPAAAIAPSSVRPATAAAPPRPEAASPPAAVQPSRPTAPQAPPAAPAPAKPTAPPGAAHPVAPPGARLPAATAQQPPAARQPAVSAAAHALPAATPQQPGRAVGTTQPLAPAPAGLAAQRGVPATAVKQPAPAQPPGARTTAPGPAVGQVPAREPVRAPQGAPAVSAPPAVGLPTGRPVPQPPAGQGEVAPPAALRAAHAAPAQPPARALTPAMGSRTAAPPREPLVAEPTSRGTPPVPAVPLIPAPAARPAVHPTPPPLTQAKVATSKPAAAAAAQPSPEKRASADAAPAPPVVPSALPATPPPFQLNPQAAARAHKPAPASNDLKPASGTIEAKSRHPNHLPPVAPPIEIADQGESATDPGSSSPAMTALRPSGRRRRATRENARDQSVKVYILIGLAIGLGIVLAYWAYWYLPFWHH